MRPATAALRAAICRPRRVTNCLGSVFCGVTLKSDLTESDPRNCAGPRLAADWRSEAHRNFVCALFVQLAEEGRPLFSTIVSVSRVLGSRVLACQPRRAPR
eukprot:5838712-Pyramimonas_sp.AAC.1